MRLVWLSRFRFAIRVFFVMIALHAAVFPPDLGAAGSREEETTSRTYTGSSGCRPCHENFYQLWAPSHHGQAMQPYSDEFAAENLTPQGEAIAVGEDRYIAAVGEGEGWVTRFGPGEERKYPIVHVMGGKNVYYFLTPMERGRLQVLPVAYDLREREWYDMAASGIRHFADIEDEPYHWTHSVYTFNTSCFGCHVSQISTNYDLETDAYNTTWTEPGINCETCHGPGDEHISVCEAAPEDEAPHDLKIIKDSEFTHDQINSLCGPCHAKMSPISLDFIPGNRFFDHYDLTTLEHVDFHPDGRDLGENYTYTSWLMSPCVQVGDLDCLHCHTSSGRYRFHGENANGACLPCHTEQVENATAHTRHPSGSDGNRCVACHMPLTRFAGMNRSDHSMRPPMPAATLEFKSPNACTLCHTDRDAAWADEAVRSWHGDDFQGPTLHVARLVDDARRERWNRLPGMLTYIAGPDRDEVFAASLIRLLESCDREEKRPVLIKSLREDPSPLVRSSAARVLGNDLIPAVIEALAAATADDYRIVRVRAAASLAPVPARILDEDMRDKVSRATDELLESFTCRPDDYASHYNLGNFFAARRDFQPAIVAYEASARLRSDFVPPLVNASLAYNALGRNRKAEESLRRALEVQPKSVAAHLNLGMLLVEMNRRHEAESEFRTVLRIEPDSAQAAYNLGVLLAGKGTTDEALSWCREAHRIEPGNPKYTYTLAFYLHDAGKTGEAVRLLEEAVEAGASLSDLYIFLARIHEERGELRRAAEVCRRAAGNRRLHPEDRASFERMADDLARRAEERRP